MSFQAITQFFKTVAADSALEGTVLTALEHRAEAAAFEIVDIARAQGFDFTATELREYLVAQESEVELSEAQLEAVAGGLLQLRALNLPGLRRIRKLPVDLLRARRLKRI
jgi:predicted ribosomally synthesized peptide with nif11-like leader